MSFEKFILFPIEFYKHKVLNSPDLLIQSLYSIKKEEIKGRSISNEGGWQSTELKSHPSFKSLIHYIELLSSKIYRHNTKILELWGNISPTGSYNSIHNHGYKSPTQKYISGVYYLKTPPNCGNLELYNPSDITDSKIYIVKKNDMIFFDSTLAHSVRPNKSSFDRVSLAFNLQII